MFKKHLKTALCVGVTLLVAGCASTTHYINLDPRVTLQQDTLTNTRQISVTTNTNLGSKIGEIHTAINERADIFLSNKVEESVQRKIIMGLESLGYRPDQGNLPANLIQIEITQMSYTTTTQALKTVATLRFNLKAKVTANNQIYTANYGSEKVDEYGSLPDQEEVETALNQLAGETVNRLLNDSNIRLLLK